jgi:hypothetical protein
VKADEKGKFSSSNYCISYFFLAANLQAVEVAEGNFVLNVPGSPDNNPLSLRITSPISGDLVNSSDVVLNFTVTKPRTWFLYGSHVIGRVAWAGYSIDDGVIQEISVNDTGMGAQNAPSVLNFSVVLSGLPQGKHDLAVSTCGESWYGGSPPHVNSVESHPMHVYFEVDSVAPELTVLTPKEEAFSDGDVALDCSVSEPASWIGYSLDNQENVTANGNTTLPNLNEGSHELTVYANDTAGNMGKSETVVFSITPSDSPTPQPTPVLSSTPSPVATEQGGNFGLNSVTTLFVIGLIAVAVITGAGVLRFRNRRASPLQKK